MQEKIRTLLKRPKENDSSHGMRVWQAGQQRWARVRTGPSSTVSSRCVSARSLSLQRTAK